MSWTRTARAVIAFALLVLLHYTVRPLLGWRTPVDFLVIAVLLSAVRVRPGAAALIGFCTGLVADSLTPSAFGAGALAMTAIICVLTSLAPALDATRVAVAPTIKGDVAVVLRRRFTLRHALAVGQVAISLLLLVTAALFIRNLARATRGSRPS